MKTIKLFLILLVALPMFTSCSDDEPIKNQANTESSIALRTMLSEYKKAHGIANRTATDAIFCFEFVYPISFSYNNGTTVTVTSFDGLLAILSDETPQFYLDGVQFPFDVIQQTPTGSVETTINSESDFVNLLESCGIDTIDEDIENTFCFDIVFPITVNTDNGPTEVADLEALQLFLNGSATGLGVDIVFPISVLYNGAVVTVNNIYELYEMIGNCDTCICTLEYAPVCVQTTVGLVEYGNSCFAMCAGYTQNDFINCDPQQICSISNLTIQTANCTPIGTYDVTIDFTWINTTSSQFEVRDSNNNLVGTYNLSNLPITIAGYSNSGQSTDHLTVSIYGNPNCTATQEWTVPCNGPCGSVCPANYNPVCVMTTTGLQHFGNECLALCAGFTQADFITCGVSPDSFVSNLGSCFFISYPVAVQYQGAVIQVNSDAQLIQYFSPATQTMPVFNYPISVTFGNIAQTLQSQTQFIAQISEHCN